jgi:hypothetical protein
MRLAPVWQRPEVERKVSLEHGARAELIAAIRSELIRKLPAVRIS